MSTLWLGPSAATMRQPMPTSNDEPLIWRLVVDDLRTFFPDGYLGVAADIEARAEMGRQKYGVGLQAHNGRNPLVDAYQEALDLSKYTRAAVEEGYPVEGLHRETLRFVVALRAQLTALGIP